MTDRKMKLKINEKGIKIERPKSSDRAKKGFNYKYIF